MENNENFVAEQVTENVEQTTEQIAEQIAPPKTYTQEELDDIVGKRIARNTAKIRKEYDKKYGELEGVLKAGTGKENLEEVTDTFKQFYQKKGIQMPQQPNYTAQDIEVLARAEADDIIRAGYEEVVEETDRLAGIGVQNMSDREKAVFKTLAEHRKTAERGRELSQIGVTEDVYGSKEFNDFAAKFNPTTPVREIYDLYAKTQPKKNYQTMGSMKHTASTDSAVKEYYSYEEAEKFTRADFDKNPELFAAVQKSMQKW